MKRIWSLLTMLMVEDGFKSKPEEQNNEKFNRPLCFQSACFPTELR
ncbi:MAG: hypothetical protein ACUVRP_09670 [Chlorobiales bacterium]